MWIDELIELLNDWEKEIKSRENIKEVSNKAYTDRETAYNEGQLQTIRCVKNELRRL